MRLKLSVDEVLTTTRTVRKRLDIARPVPREVIEECLELAVQAPNGSNRNQWRWIVVDAPELIAKIAVEYNVAMDMMMDIIKSGEAAGRVGPNPDNPREDKMLDSAAALAEKMGRMPALLIPLMPGRPDGGSAFDQAPMWGSIVQAVWSFMLALRERGLGSAWTTASLHRERDIAALLDIPFDDYTQVGLFPIAYTIGTDFKRAWRRPIADVLSYNRFQPNS